MDPDAIAFWDAQAAVFDEAADHGLAGPAARLAWRALLASALPAPPARVADLGCGTGTLSLLLAEMGYDVDAVDFSPRMLEQARLKAATRSGPAFHLGDAAAPPLPAGEFEAVLCRHVLWALTEPLEALRRWGALLTSTGRLVLIEGRWHTGAGMAAAEAVGLVAGAGRQATVETLDDPALWGREITDERYILISLNEPKVVSAP